MLKLVSFVVAIGISALGLYLVRRRAYKEQKLTDKRARAEVFKQLLAMSEENMQPAAGKKAENRDEKNTPKPARTPPPPAPFVTRQQRRAEQRRKDKIALAKGQHA